MATSPAVREASFSTAPSSPPKAGIATLTYLWEGTVRYEDTTGATGLLPAGGVEWFKAAGGAWHGGGAGNSGRSRGFQLWLALPPDQELGPSESIYQKPQDVHANGPAAVLLGTLGKVSSQVIRMNSPSDTIRCIRVRPRFKPANGASPR
jgi:redox-sensitive bicupin YhaK (pirin superfamily)